MNEKSKIKVKRSRKRLYESVKDDLNSVAFEKTEETKEEIKGKKEIKDRDEENNRIKQSNEIVNSGVRWAIAVSIVPIPVLDIVTVFVVQLRMLTKLSDHYGIDFSETLVKSLVSSLIGGLNSGLIGGKLMMSIFKLFPGTGLIAGITSMCVIAGATTYAVGKVFIQHFESGGTFLDFDPIKVKDYFAKKFEDGEKIAEKVKRNIKDSKIT